MQCTWGKHTMIQIIKCHGYKAQKAFYNNCITVNLRLSKMLYSPRRKQKKKKKKKEMPPKTVPEKNGCDWENLNILKQSKRKSPFYSWDKVYLMTCHNDTEAFKMKVSGYFKLH